MNNDGKVETHRRQRLAQVVIDTLRDRILTGDLTEGDQLPTEGQLEAEFGVSRTVVREAIAELRAGGLVTPLQGKGVFVAKQQPVRQQASLTPREIKSIRKPLNCWSFGLQWKWKPRRFRPIGARRIRRKPFVQPINK